MFGSSFNKIYGNNGIGMQIQAGIDLGVRKQMRGSLALPMRL